MSVKSRNGDLHAEIVAMVGEGRTQAQAARALGVSPSTVSRALADRREAGVHRATGDAVDAFVRSLGPELTPDVLARVEALRALAAKLDWATRASTGTAAMAAASLAREYRSLLDELRQASSFDELREALLAAGD
ncbi:MAG: helix-turn-helix domain-containing protein [Solirubrobacteraceae bacterium]